MKTSERITGILRQRAQAMAPGEKLPSIRLLMSRYSCSLHSVNVALAQLEADGLVMRRKGSGLYVNPQKGSRFIELHRHHYPSANMDAKEISLSNAITKVGWKMATLRHPVAGDDSGIRPNPKACAHVVMSPIFETAPAFFSQMAEQSARILLYGQTCGPLQLDYVSGDDYRYMSLLIKHLHGLGHRHIAFLANEPVMHSQDEKTELFQSIAGLLDMPAPTVIDCRTQRGASSFLQAYLGLKEHLSSQRGLPKFTALITASAKGVIGSLRAFSEKGMSVPGDCSLASFGLSMENAYLTPSITEVGVTEDAWGQGVVTALKHRFEHPDAPPIGLKLPPDLIVRESTAPPRK